MKKCCLCGGEIATFRDKPYKYTESGLDIKIYGLSQHQCKGCGETFVSIPNIQKLHRVIGRTICEQRKALLLPEEIKFMRKDLHLKGKQFANILGVDASTVSRWENGKQQIGETQDRLFRAIYLMYASEQAENVGTGILDVFSCLPAKRKNIKKKEIILNPPEWLLENQNLCEAC